MRDPAFGVEHVDAEAHAPTARQMRMAVRVRTLIIVQLWRVAGGGDAAVHYSWPMLLHRVDPHQGGLMLTLRACASLARATRPAVRALPPTRTGRLGLV